MRVWFSSFVQSRESDRTHSGVEITNRKATMQTFLASIIRVASYPMVFGLCTIALLSVASLNLSYWPWMPLISAVGITVVALLERIQPYEKQWLDDHGDTAVDVLHAFFSLTLIFTSVEMVTFLRTFVPITGLWPSHWPVWGQVLCAGAIIDFGLWFMHWASHQNLLLWRLHALHHSAERLYWLNGERRHPLSALVLAAPGITVAVMLGAPAIVIGCWLAMASVHLAFQHANLDYTVGPFRSLLGVAEIHRWHHKREYDDAQVNFGEFWMLWDHLFGTYRYQTNGVKAGEVGMPQLMPIRYFEQLAWPFQRQETTTNQKAD